MALVQGVFGEEGKATFKNSRTSVTYDPANITGNVITLDKTHLFVTGHKVQITEDASGTIDSALSTGTDYFVIVVNTTDISLATSEANALAGTAIVLTGDGSGADHVIALQEYDLLASCKNWNISFEKAVADTTTLSSTFRSYKGGLINATGSMTVQYEADDSLAARKARKIFDSLVLPYDEGEGSVELYLSSTDVSDEDRKIVADVIYTSGSIAVQVGSIIEATVNFQLNGQPTFTNFAS